MTIAAAQVINSIHITGDVTLDSTSGYDGFTFQAQSSLKGSVDLNNQSVDGCNFSDLTLQGQCNGSIHAENCRVNSCTDLAGCLHDSVLFGSSISIKAGETLMCKDVSGATATAIEVDMNGTGILIGNPIYGQIELKNMTSPASWAAVVGTNNLILNSSITAGVVFLAGGGALTNNATSLTQLINDLTADQTWDVPLADHLQAGSTGEKLNDSTSGLDDLTISTIVDGVWDEPLADHLDAGSTGEKLNIGSTGTSGSSGYIVDEQIVDHFPVVDSGSGQLVTGIDSTNFDVFIFDPVNCDRVIGCGGDSTAIDYTIEEIGTTGLYKLAFTPDTEGLWVVLITHATYFPWGKSYNYVVVAASDGDGGSGSSEGITNDELLAIILATS
jgi:hypothetical protein